jgi:hypothetical protein
MTILMTPKSELESSTEAPACNPATQEAEIRRIEVQSQPGNSVRPYLGLVEWLKVKA